MSYILDALKKAERERGLTDVPRLETVHDLPLEKKTGVWIAAGCSVLCLIAAGWMFFSVSSGRIESKTPAPVTIDQGSVTEDSESLSENRESIVQSSNTPPVSKPVSGGIARNRPIPETVNAPVAAVPKAKPRTAVAEPESSSLDVKTEPAVAANTDVTMQISPPVDDSAELSAPDAATPTVAGQESPQISGNLPSLREIAASMKVSVHIYSENPDERIVFINGKQRKEGAYLEQDCVLESITPEGVVLKRREETFVFHLDVP